MLGTSMGSSQSNSYGNTTRQVQPYMYPTEDNLVQTISQMMLGGNNPTIQGMKTNAVNQVNQGYAAMPRTIASRLSGLAARVRTPIFGRSAI